MRAVTTNHDNLHMSLDSSAHDQRPTEQLLIPAPRPKNIQDAASREESKEVVDASNPTGLTMAAIGQVVQSSGQLPPKAKVITTIPRDGIRFASDEPSDGIIKT